MRLTYFYILKTILILNLLFCSLSFADNHDINKTLELIQKNINFTFINLYINFISMLIYDYKNGKKKTLKLYASGSLNINY